MTQCKSIGCSNPPSKGQDFCSTCLRTKIPKSEPISLNQKYPQYFKSVDGFNEIDVYTVHHLFEIDDPSGCIQHASKKLLLSGVRTGGKSQYKDIKEARDTLTRWLQIQGHED